jgi:hypothetical protein
MTPSLLGAGNPPAPPPTPFLPGDLSTRLPPSKMTRTTNPLQPQAPDAGAHPSASFSVHTLADNLLAMSATAPPAQEAPPRSLSDLPR